MFSRENYLRNARLAYPRSTPAAVYISPASYVQYGAEMAGVAARYPELVRGQPREEGALTLPQRGRFTDPFGCTWEMAVDGIEGFVTGHPLADWDPSYRLPDPLAYLGPYTIDWPHIRRSGDEVFFCSLVHGFLLLRAQYLRGFENLMMDVATGEPRLLELLANLTDYSAAIVNRFLALGADVIGLPEDLGTQDRLIMGPPHFRRLILPAYRQLTGLIHGRALTHIHSDGYILEIADDLLSCGFDIINPQDLVNGVAELKRAFKGRACIDLDIDRQRILPFGTPGEIHDLIEMEIKELGSERGGLMLTAGIYPPTPPENVDALCRAIIKWKDFYLGG